MKIRHVRAVAVCALVVVALTGARGSHGGGCGGSHGSSSSSGGEYSSGSTSSGGYSSSGSTTGGTTTSGTTTGSPSSGSTTPPESDIRITDCQVDSAAATLTAKLSVTNGNSTSPATYNGSVRFTDASGGYVGVVQISSLKVAAGQTLPTTVTGTFIKSPSEQGTLSGKCTLGSVWKVNG
ncbi:hypothetical protein ACGFOU_11085 [Streptomyces sp. NPDC048595]|uniref:hypothetical protein n=1 Tax=Streptomyces sp. NPDC048595 TaxID=3365576 RepID=UPI00371A3C03